MPLNKVGLTCFHDLILKAYVFFSEALILLLGLDVTSAEGPVLHPLFHSYHYPATARKLVQLRGSALTKHLRR
ncbi:hypothetical protein P8452_16732 [Trifolium repens]|nr:hypothetical protein P8452_16732 [Trifolium repens]